MVEEVALQRPCFAVVRTTAMLAWVGPDPVSPSSSDEDGGSLWSARCRAKRVLKSRTGMVWEKSILFRVVN